MKKKPKEIVSILLNSLNNLEIGNEYSINEVSENAGLHWNTTNEYIEIMKNFAVYAPKIMINENNNKIRVVSHSSYLDRLTINQKILVFLFEHRAFDITSAKPLDQLNENNPKDKIEDISFYIDDLILKEQISRIQTESGEPKYIILNDGKEIVHSIYNQITTEIFDIKNNIAIPKAEDQERENDVLIQQNRIISQKITELEKDKEYLQSQNSKLLSLLEDLFKSKGNSCERENIIRYINA